jgi:hypothetical protein
MRNLSMKLQELKNKSMKQLFCLSDPTVVKTKCLPFSPWLQTYIKGVFLFGIFNACVF